jgi:hypothetical protein
MSSGGVINGAGFSDHSITEVAAEITGRSQIHLATNEVGQFQLHLREREEAWSVVGKELHKEIHVAAGMEAAGQR